VSYSFDSLASDQDLSVTRGQYELSELALDVGGFQASTNTGTNYTGLIYVDNNHNLLGRDQYTLNTTAGPGFYAHDSSPINGRELIAVAVQLRDNDESIFDTDALPLTALDITEFESATLELLFSNNWTSGAAFDAQWVRGTVTSASISPVPAPAAIWLFGAALIGLAGFRKRRKSSLI
jgi:hypothetical protein